LVRDCQAVAGQDRELGEEPLELIDAEEVAGKAGG
jgi:hypothetical protein